MWHLARGASEQEAVADASYREKELDENELATALQWARDSVQFAEALAMSLPAGGLCCDEESPADDADLWTMLQQFGLPRQE
jgi:hypothetical protein